MVEIGRVLFLIVGVVLMVWVLYGIFDKLFLVYLLKFFCYKCYVVLLFDLFLK